MKHFKEIVRPAQPAYTEQIEENVTCDFCKKDIKTSFYDINEVTIEHREGDSYPSGGTTTTTSVDMCGKCFKEKLIPWIKSQGAELQIKDNDW